MRYPQAFAALALVTVTVSLYTMLAGGFPWYPAVPLVLAVTGAGFAFIPVARRPGIVTCCCALAVVALGAQRYKYFAPLQFAAFAGLFTAAIACISATLATWLVIPFAFMEAFWLASLTRQTAFEIATAGSPTLRWDSCTVALMPLIIGVLLFAAFAVAAFANLTEWMFTSPESRLRSTAGPTAAARFHAGGRITATVIALIGGAAFGATAWTDWQINQSCL